MSHVNPYWLPFRMPVLIARSSSGRCVAHFSCAAFRRFFSCEGHPTAVSAVRAVDAFRTPRGFPELSEPQDGLPGCSPHDLSPVWVFLPTGRVPHSIRLAMSAPRALPAFRYGELRRLWLRGRRAGGGLPTAYSGPSGCPESSQSAESLLLFHFGPELRESCGASGLQLLLVFFKARRGCHCPPNKIVVGARRCGKHKGTVNQQLSEYFQDLMATQVEICST